MHSKQLCLIHVLTKVPSKTSNHRKNVIFDHTNSFSTQNTGSGLYISETVGNHDLSTLNKTFHHASQTTLPHMCPYISHLQDPQTSKKPSFLTPHQTHPCSTQKTGKLNRSVFTFLMPKPLRTLPICIPNIFGSYVPY